MESNKPLIHASAYLAYYGLIREPFSDEVEDDLFYAESTHKQRLDQLLHLSQYGNELLVVTAEEGIGKTTLLHQVMAHAMDNWRVVQLDATSIPDERKLVQQLCREFSVKYQNTAHAEILQALTHFLDGLLHNAHQGVLLVDNAHLLQPTALKRLADLASRTGKDGKPLLRVIVFGEAILAENLKDPVLGELANMPMHQLELPPYSKEESILYILHRLSAARFADTEPFTDAALQKICKEAGGNPARLNQLSHRLLSDSLPKQLEAADSPFENKQLRRPAQLLAGIVTLSLLAAVLIYQSGLLEPDATSSRSEQESETVQAPLALPDNPPAGETHTQAHGPTAAPTPLAQAPEAGSARTKPAETAPEDEEPELALPPLTRVPSPETEPEAEPEPEMETEAPTHIATPTAAPAAKKVPPRAAPQPAPVVTKGAKPPSLSSLPTHTDDWIRRQAATAYTLQLIAGRQTSTLEKFITEHQLKGDEQLAFYQGTRDGAPWYGLIYGVYPDKQAAIDARSRLPQQLRQLKPWVRNLGELQHSLP